MTARRGRGAETLVGGEEGSPAEPGVVASLFVGGRGVGSFAGAHEAVAGAIVGDGLVGFVESLHVDDGLGNRCADALVIAGVEAEYRRVDAGHGVFVGRRAIENERCRKIGTIGGEAEGLATSPAKADDEELAVGGRELFAVVGGGVEVSGDLVGIEFVNGLHDVVGRNAVGAATVGSHAGEKIGSDGDIACGGDLIGEVFDPVGHAEDFVDDEDDGSFVFGFGVDDEGFYGAAIVLDGDPFAMARRFIEFGDGPVLRGSGRRGDERSAEGDGEEEKMDAFHGAPRAKESCEMVMRAAKGSKRSGGREPVEDRN